MKRSGDNPMAVTTASSTPSSGTVLTPTIPSRGIPSNIWSATGGISSANLPYVGVGGMINYVDPTTGQPTATPPGMSIAGSGRLNRYLYLKPGVSQIASQQMQNTISSFIQAEIGQGYNQTSPNVLERMESSNLKSIITIDPITGTYGTTFAQVGGVQTSSAPPVDVIGNLMKNVASGQTLVSGTGAASKIASWLYPENQMVQQAAASGALSAATIASGKLPTTAAQKTGTVFVTTPSGTMSMDAANYARAVVNSNLPSSMQTTKAPATESAAEFAQGTLVTLASGQQVIRNITGVDASGKPIKVDTPVTKTTSTPSKATTTSGSTYTVTTASGATETRQNVGGGYKVVASTPAPAKTTTTTKTTSDKKSKSYRLFSSDNPLSKFLGRESSSNPLASFLHTGLPKKFKM